MTKAKPGDRVRVTFEGTVAAGGYISGTGDRYYSEPRFYIERGATVEVLPPPSPEWARRVGTIVLDRYGNAWQCSSPSCWYRVRAEWPQTYDELLGRHGPLTLVYDPEASNG